MSPENQVPRNRCNQERVSKESGEQLSPVHMQSRPSKEVQELLALDWRRKWRGKLGNDHSVLREVYEYPRGMWNRNLFFFSLFWIIISGGVFSVLAWLGVWDRLVLGLVLVPMALFFFFMYAIIALNERLKPRWNVVQITKKYFIYTWAYTPDLDFLEMVHSEDKITYPQIAAELESITKIKKGFGSYFVRENPGSPGMIIIAVRFGPGSPYGAGWEEEFPVPASVLPGILMKLKETAPAIIIDPELGP